MPESIMFFLLSSSKPRNEKYDTSSRFKDVLLHLHIQPNFPCLLSIYLYTDNNQNLFPLSAVSMHLCAVNMFRSTKNIIYSLVTWIKHQMQDCLLKYQFTGSSVYPPNVSKLCGCPQIITCLQILPLKLFFVMSFILAQ